MNPEGCLHWAKINQMTLRNPHKPMRALILSIVLFPAALLHAQNARPVNCRFLSFGGSPEMSSVISLSAKGEPSACPLPTHELSNNVVCYAKNNAIDFSLTDKSPAATATIPAGAKSVLLLFVANPKAPDADAAKSLPWRVIAIEDSPKNFPFGGASIANLSSNDIRFEIGEHKGVLPPDGTQGFPIPKQLDDFNMAPLLVEARQGDNWRTASETSLRFLPSTRYLILAHADSASGRLRVNTYQDMEPIAPPKGKTKSTR